MTERRETGRPRRKPSGVKGKPGGKPGPGHKSPQARGPAAEPDWSEGERIAKYLARAGVASRREVERLIEEGKVSVDGKKLTSPAFKVTGKELIRVGRRTISAPEATRVWRYHKPSGLITTNVRPGRPPHDFRRAAAHPAPRGDRWPSRPHHRRPAAAHQ
jgi:23S rRNA pseudouridine2605 synthase